MADILEQIAENNQKIYLEKKLEVSLSKMMDMARGQLFHWTFSDTSDAQETTRRNNIVKRFFCLMRGRK